MSPIPKTIWHIITNHAAICLWKGTHPSLGRSNRHPRAKSCPFPKWAACTIGIVELPELRCPGCISLTSRCVGHPTRSGQMPLALFHAGCRRWPNVSLWADSCWRRDCAELSALSAPAIVAAAERFGMDNLRHGRSKWSGSHDDNSKLKHQHQPARQRPHQRERERN